ncbi:uncharacterized protein TrAFT101_001049 [Trichoderma asperellum]|uniref:uncharacterized protein n=1 Tax=Trichoderma asperellum TaxID=101201 RepID=UPI0033251485|nr:hypothetical protein TrAFT101_001049 [Trichoderma asperellum]
MACVGQSWTAMQSKQAVRVVMLSLEAAAEQRESGAGARAAKEASGEVGPSCGRLGPVLHKAMQRSLLQDKGATSRVESGRAQGTTAGAAKRLMSSRRRNKRIDREEKMAEEKMATSWRWGVGEKAAKMPVEAGTRDWPRQRSPPMVP